MLPISQSIVGSILSALVAPAAPSGDEPDNPPEDAPFFSDDRLDDAEPPPPDAPPVEPPVEPAKDPSPPKPSVPPPRATAEQRAPVPPMPEVEEITKPPAAGERKTGGGGFFDLTRGDEDRPPAGAEGGSFFDPGRLADDGPGGGSVQIRGFVAAEFYVAQRTDTRRRDDQGRFRELDPLAFFDLSSASLYVGAPIFADVVYARVAFEFASIPTQQDRGSNFDIISQSRRFLFFESGAIEVNPFTWAKSAAPWFRQGFKLTGGVFIVPFGLEGEDHAAPINWFITRPRSMSIGRVFPGVWVDAGAVLKWKPTFRSEKPIRPIEIDVGIVNGDACTQTRFVDQLFSPTGTSARCERRLREGEVAGGAPVIPDGSTRIDGVVVGISPDNNGAKSYFARVQAFPLPALNFGGSFVWGKHPEGGQLPESGQTPAELGQAPTWRVGAHFDLDLDQTIQSPYPLPMMRAEFVYGEDDAVERAVPEQTRRRMMGGYAQIAQPLFRRKKSRLPGLMVQYRFDQADPDLAVPGTSNGVALVSDFSSTTFLGESAVQSHTVGLRFPVLPRFMLKAEYTFAREDGGSQNQLNNDLFGFEAVADF